MKNKCINLFRCIIMLALVISMMFSSTGQTLIAADEDTSANYTIPNGTYWIINAHTGKALTVYNSGTANGTNIVQSDNVNGANQRWQVNTHYDEHAYPNRQFTLIIADGTYGACLSTASSTMSNGVNVQLSTSCSPITSHWDIYKPSLRGNYMIQSKCGANFVVAVENSSNTNVYINTYNGTDYCNDEWIFVPVSGYSLKTSTVKVQLDDSVRDEYEDTSEFRAIFADATKPFYTKFHIQLIPTFYNLQEIPADSCSLNYDFMCSQNLCGNNNTCHNGNSLPNHHKNFKYNGLWTFENTSMTNFDFRLVMTAQNACYINSSGTHSNLILGTTFYNYDSIIVKCNEYSRGHMLNVRVIQHEFSHAFGCPDHDPVADDPCIMAQGFDKNFVYNLDDIWCSSCNTAISSYLNTTN